MKLTLVRHGETEEGKRIVLLGGSRQGTLSEKGIKQAKDIALKLKNRKFEAIYSSDLARALDTAKEIMKYHNGTTFYALSDLRERDVGDLAGKSFKTPDELYAVGLRSDLRTGETLGQFQNRLRLFLKPVYDRYRHESVLFVCHGGVIKAYQNILEHAQPSQMHKRRLLTTGTSLTLNLQ
ncbi:MAG: histidine phosphatase family protein [Candidatus Micrarchaeota archaeon]|nr:histidine phosphatase family protein [Candidatus Micrarchaeota archaeon]MDE1848271.1 histidine phosphatase family protein [Candidatus Micrarchaeota archaeon]